jgi:RNA polymerase sigma-70 factor (ECF subfamily)
MSALRATVARRPALDSESREWLRVLTADGPAHEAGIERLHGVLLRAARAEVRRRCVNRTLGGPELDDLAHQVAADALIAVTGKIGEFRGESRFTTWAYRFVIFQAATKVNRHFWHGPVVTMGDADWDRLPDRFGFAPDERAELHDLCAALRRAVDEELTEHQRRIFGALILRDVPLDVLADQLGSSRNALYKTMFDARRKLRRALAAGGHMPAEVTTA